MSEVLTDSIQDYLKSIYELTADGRAASTTALAARLGIAPASVTGMLQRLAGVQPPLVLYRKHQGVTLTSEGRRAALEVIRHHRLLEAWLVQALGYSWDAVHEEADRLEHVISEEFEERIASALSDPLRDPHGDPIPTRDLVMPPDESRPLATLQPDQRAVVLRVHSEEPALLRHLEGLGLVPGAQMDVTAHSPYDDNLTVKISGRAAAVLGPAITNKIFVKVLV